jgi:hypothetical protein
LGPHWTNWRRLVLSKSHSTERWPKGPNIGDRICSYWIYSYWPRVQNSKVLDRGVAGGDGSRPWKRQPEPWNGYEPAAENLKAASAETAPKPGVETAPKANFASAETAPLAMAETAALSISRVGTPSEIGNLATHDHPNVTRPSRFRCRRAGTLSSERWGQAKPDPAPAKQPRRAGVLSKARWRAAPDTGPNSQRPIAPEALPSDAASPISNAHRGEPPRLMVDVSTPPAPTAALVH